MRRLVEMGLAEARRILTEKREDLDTLAKALLEYETLTGDEIMGLLKGKPPVRDTGEEPPAAPRPSPVPSTGKARPKRGPTPGPSHSRRLDEHAYNSSQAGAGFLWCRSGVKRPSPSGDH